tara:strand:+ start:733 stop:918 length:186 start_codon:yes stop_codon:yes gene_type:complete
MNKWDLDKYLDILELRYVEGLTFEAIGQRYNVTRARAQAIVKKAKRFADKKYYCNSLDWLC